MYYSIIESLKSMAKKKGFLEKCNLWRTRSEHTLAVVKSQVVLQSPFVERFHCTLLVQYI